MQFRFCLLVILVLLTTSCIQVGGREVPQLNHYLLVSTAEAPLPATTGAITVGLEIATFPDYLKRTQIATRQQANRIHYSTNHRWAEALDGQLLRIIRDDLATRLPQATILLHPWETKTVPTYNITLMVSDFSGTLGESSQTDIRWRITSANGKHSDGRFHDSRTIGGNYGDLAAGLSSSIEQLSLQLAQALIAL